MKYPVAWITFVFATVDTGLPPQVAQQILLIAAEEREEYF
jgi:hypothetical protein